MKKHFEKRQCRRFEIPKAYVQYKKRGLLGMLSPLSDKLELQNISKGGVCFVSQEEINIGDKVMIHLCLPNNNVLAVKGSVSWKEPKLPGGTRVGVKFVAFKKGNGYNSTETLEKLRFLDPLYFGQKNRLKRAA